MNISFDSNRRSATVKVASIGLLILVLLIPVSMVKSVVYDRINVASEAVADIRQSWGGSQTIAGPLLRVPFSSETTNAHGEIYTIERYALLVADDLEGTAEVNVEMRYRGIHEVPVYQTDLDLKVRFDLTRFEMLGLDPDSFLWPKAELLVGMTDLAAMNETPSAKIANDQAEFAGTSHQVSGLPQVLTTNIGPFLQRLADSKSLSANIRLSFNGTDSLQFVPLAERSEVSTAANWSSPSFSGRRLPTEREVTQSGFDATWKSTSIGRNLPPTWIEGTATPAMNSNGIFGVRFMMPIGLYQQMDRALKYAVMFIGLTFISYFLMETVAKVRLHPLQYLLVGLANSLFYLLLLSLAEHIGFGLAYIASSSASAALIIGYSATVLATKLRALVMVAVLSGLYGFLYLTLMAESFALLAGSIGLWVILGAVMYLTRKIDWYTAAETVVEKE